MKPKAHHKIECGGRSEVPKITGRAVCVYMFCPNGVQLYVLYKRKVYNVRSYFLIHRMVNRVECLELAEILAVRFKGPRFSHLAWSSVFFLSRC